MNRQRPFAEATDRNKDPIAEYLSDWFCQVSSVLEIGSGTGQHAVHFAKLFAHLDWHTSDRVANHRGIEAWISASGLANVHPPLALDVLTDPWPESVYDAAYTANTAHIMSADAVEAMFDGVAKRLELGGQFVLYGPLRFNGAFTTASNQAFDAMLQQRDPESGIRDFEWLGELAARGGLYLDQCVDMPANNHLVRWLKKAS